MYIDVRPGLQLSIVLVLFLLALQVYQAIAVPNAGQHSYEKRVEYLDGCGPYRNVLTDGLEDVKGMGLAGFQAIKWFERNVYNPASDEREKRRILWMLEALFGDILAAPDGRLAVQKLDSLKGIEFKTPPLLTEFRTLR